MTPEIVRLTAADFDEAMDLLNLVFSMAHRPHNFARMLPLLYRPTDEHMGYNRAIRSGSRIRAIVGVIPVRWSVGGTILQGAGVGGVAVHWADCGRGYMKLLMQRCGEDILDGGFDLSWLGGQRQRYQHSGYESAGIAIQASVCRANLKGFAVPPMAFSAVGQGDESTLREMRSLHDRQMLHSLRDDRDFALRCISWHNSPRVARRPDGTLAGYLVANGDGHVVTEIGAPDARSALDVAAAWVASQGDSAFELSASDPGAVALFATLAEGISVRSCGNWRILNWPKVVGALLKARAAAAPLPDGRVVVDVGAPRRLAIIVRDGSAACEATAEPPDLTADTLTATRLLFGPLKPSMVMPLPSKAAILDAWCPLPLIWRTQDGV